jgi:hypothetical protein
MREENAMVVPLRQQDRGGHLDLEVALERGLEHGDGELLPRRGGRRPLEHLGWGRGWGWVLELVLG